MISQSIYQYQIRGQGQAVDLLHGIFLLALCVGLGPWVEQIPMAALVAIMIMVSIGTFSWQSMADLRKHPRSSSVVMLATVVTVVTTRNRFLAFWLVFFCPVFSLPENCWRCFRLTSTASSDGRYRGPMWWRDRYFLHPLISSLQSFDFKEALEKVTIDLSKHISGIFPAFQLWTPM